jgi:hypothetical protein
MITWNYRVFQEPEGDFTIREVFYNEGGEITGCTANPVEPFGETLAELHQCLQDFQAALELPILTLADLPQCSEFPRSLSSNSLSSEQVYEALGLSTVDINIKEADDLQIAS